MTVSNPPSLSSIIAEFGSGGNPPNLYAYRWGGGIVGGNLPVGDGTPGNPVKISQFANLTYIPPWNAVMTVGQTSSSPLQRGWGVPAYTGGLNGAALSKTTIDTLGGASALHVLWMSNGNLLSLTVFGILPNSGWTTLTCNGTSYQREAASFSNAYSTKFNPDSTRWTWPSGDPFGNIATGNTCNITMIGQ